MHFTEHIPHGKWWCIVIQVSLLQRSCEDASSAKSQRWPRERSEPLPTIELADWYSRSLHETDPHATATWTTHSIHLQLQAFSVTVYCIVSWAVCKCNKNQLTGITVKHWTKIHQSRSYQWIASNQFTILITTDFPSLAKHFLLDKFSHRVFL